MQLPNTNAQELMPRVELGQFNVVYNVPHPLLQLHIQDKLTLNAFLILTQEIPPTRDVGRRPQYHHLNMFPPAQQVTNLWWIIAHLDFTLHILCS
jgi:hypothetical protein